MTTSCKKSKMCPHVLSAKVANFWLCLKPTPKLASIIQKCHQTSRDTNKTEKECTVLVFNWKRCSVTQDRWELKRHAPTLYWRFSCGRCGTMRRALLREGCLQVAVKRRSQRSSSGSYSFHSYSNVSVRRQICYTWIIHINFHLS